MTGTLTVVGVIGSIGALLVALLIQVGIVYGSVYLYGQMHGFYPKPAKKEKKAIKTEYY